MNEIVNANGWEIKSLCLNFYRHSKINVQVGGGGLVARVSTFSRQNWDISSTTAPACTLCPNTPTTTTLVLDSVKMYISGVVILLLYSIFQVSQASYYHLLNGGLALPPHTQDRLYCSAAIFDALCVVPILLLWPFGSFFYLQYTKKIL